MDYYGLLWVLWIWSIVIKSMEFIRHSRQRVTREDSTHRLWSFYPPVMKHGNVLLMEGK